MDKVGINAPSGNVIHFKSVERAAELFGERGWDVTIGEDVYTSFGRFGGSSESARLNDFQQACSDTELVLCARGGYGFSRLLPNLDFNKIKSNGTWVAGFSDITFFTTAYLALTGGKSLQAPTASVLGDLKCDPYTIQTFFELLAAEEYKLFFPTPFPDLQTSGLLWGGNLTVLCSMLGTKYFPKVEGGILFVEDIAEPAYKIERDLNHLLQAGVIDNQNAVILGDFSKIKSSEHDFGYGLEDALSYIAGQTKTPFISGLPFGHEMKTATLVVGAEAHLNVQSNMAELRMTGCPNFKASGVQK